MAESIVLDPSEVATNRTELDLHSGPLLVREEGPDWGEAAIQAYMAEASRGQVPVDFRVPNREVRIPLMAQDHGATGLATARARLQSKAALFQREGGWLMRELSDGSKLYLDVVNATLKLGGGTHQAQHDVDRDIELVLECIPDFYGAEVTLADHVETSAAELVFVEGGYPGAVLSDNPLSYWRLGEQAGTSARDERRVNDGTYQNTPTLGVAGLLTGDNDTAVNFDIAQSEYVSLPAFGLPVPWTIEAWVKVASNATWGTIVGANSFRFQRIGGSGTLRLEVPGLLVEGGVLSPGVSYMAAATYDGTTVRLYVNGAEVASGAVTIAAVTQLRLWRDGLSGIGGDDYWNGVGDEVAIYNTALPATRLLAHYEAGTSPPTYVKGDYPGRVRIVVDEDDADSQLGLLWAFRSRHYSSASTAALSYEAEELTPLDTAASAALTGASGGNVIRHTNLATSWTPVLGTNLLAGTYLTHVGSYRVYGRLYSTSPSDTVDVKARWVWDVGDLTLPEENAAWTFPGASNFYIADLGEIRLDEIQTGTHRWQGQLQAKGTVGGEQIQVDKLWFVPLDEGMGKLRAPVDASIGLSTYSARDEFNQSAGALAGKAAVIGGTWSGAGDADDFSVETTGKTAQRTAVSDADINTGRYAISGVAAFAAQVVQGDFKQSVGNLGPSGLLARYTDVNNWCRVMHTTVAFPGMANTPLLYVEKRVAGTVSFLYPNIEMATEPGPNEWWTQRFLVDAHGRWTFWLFRQGASPGDPVAQGQDTALATGGALATGKPGFYDYHGSATAETRNYDNFAAWVPTQDAVLFASQSAELRHDGHVREDSAGAAYGPVSFVEGDLPRIPPSGLEGRTVEVFLKASRGDLDQLPDSGIDDLSARVHYRPSWLTVPGT